MVCPMVDFMISHCRACDSQQLEKLVDLGPQPASHLFPTVDKEKAERRPLALGLCETCGVVQWVTGWKSEEFSSDTFEYREPESHLDAVAAQINHVLPNRFRIGLVSKKDLSLAQRLTRGTVVDSPPYDLLLARHSIEHVDSLTEWLAIRRAQLSPGGFLYVEVPCAREALRRGDVTLLWEQHQVYLTSKTLQRILSRHGFRPSLVDTPLAGSQSEGIAAVLAPLGQNAISSLEHEEIALARAFPLRLVWQKKKWEGFLAGKSVAALGAGHDLCSFLNFHSLHRQIQFVADDHPRKLGHFLPGTSLPILPVTAIRKSRADFCLLGVMGESEEKVLERLDDFLTQGGEVFSIYPLSKLAPRQVCQAEDSPLSFAHLERN